MRTPFVLLTSLSCLLATAQVDINKIMQQHAGGGQGTGQDQGNGGGPGTGGGPGNGMHIQDDNDPFVPNSFVGSFRMENHVFKNGIEEKNSPFNLRYWSTAEMTLMKTEVPGQKGQDMKMMTDLKGKWQYMMMTDAKGQRTAMKSRKKKITLKDDGKAATGEVTVTEETKVIDGHTCVKVVSKSPEGTWTGWVAKDLPSPFSDMMRNVKAGDPTMNQRMSQLNGMTLEFEWTDANGTDSMRCYLKDVVVGNVDASLFSLEGYQVMEIPNMNFGQ